MPAKSDGSISALCDFHAQVAEDVQRGFQSPLSVYLARFPGFELAIAREYLSLFAAHSDASVAFGPADEGMDPLKFALTEARGPIDRYRIGREIGRGGTAKVVSVRDLQLDRELAMKILRRDGAAVRWRFLKEARITGRLDHPGVVPIHELGVDASEQLFFTMRWVDGIAFEDAITRVHASDPEWTISRALEALIRVCDTMAFAHSRGIVHRDLKPANVMVGRFGETYVMDWGLACATEAEDIEAVTVPGAPARADDAHEHDEDMPRFTLEGDVLGTPAYMPPEQANGEIDAIGPAADIYSAGAILYHLLAGAAPYGDIENRLRHRDVLHRVRAGPPTPVRALRSTAPVELVAICDKAMQRRPENRYSDMLQMSRDLRAFLEQRVVSAHDTGLWGHAIKWILRNRTLTAAISVGIIGSLIALGIILAERAEARKRLIDLSGSQLLRGFDAMWPPRPECTAVVERWIADVELYLASRMEIRARLQALRARAKPMNPNHSAELGERAAHEDLQRRRSAFIEELKQAQLELQKGGNRVPRGVNRAGLQTELSRHEADLESDRTRPIPHKTFEFEDPDDQRLHDALVRITEDQAALVESDHDLSLLDLAEWGLHASQTVVEQSVDAARGTWEAAIASVSDPRTCPQYGGLKIRPQLGLVPIGRDSRSGLWEFAHVLSGAAPSRAQDGVLQITEETGIVLVLVPGGTLLRGSQRLDPQQRNYDAWAESNAPCGTEILLEPYFLSKYEMTQAQWWRVANKNPSYYAPGFTCGAVTVTGVHPVERVSYDETLRLLHVMGLGLPTEAQWEWAARAGTDTPWNCGDDPCALVGYANFADVNSMLGPESDPPETAFVHLDDGWSIHAPVGTFEANRFGLHDMLGNVREWCRDEGGFSYASLARILTGERTGAGDGTKVVRGGSYGQSPLRARSAARDQVGPALRWPDLGVRPSRRIDW